MVNIGLKKGNNETDFIGSGFFIKDDSFDGLVQKVKDKRIVSSRNFLHVLFSDKSLHGRSILIVVLVQESLDYPG